MASVKRVSGDYEIVSVNKATGDNVLVRTHTLTVDGNLTVVGSTTQVDVQQVTIEDPYITVGNNNDGTFNELGIEVVKGPTNASKAGLRWNTAADRWEVSKDNSTWEPILTSGGAFALIDDTNPTLGASLNTNGFLIYDAADVLIAPGSSELSVDDTLKLPHRLTDATAEEDYTKIYAKAMGAGGTGLYISCEDESSTPVQEELVSKSKAIIYSIIF